MFYGLQLAVNSGVQQVEIESDSANLVNLILGEDTSFHPLGTVIANCKLLSSNFFSCNTRHIHREKNSVADILPKASLGSAKRIIWLNEATNAIADALRDDIFGVSKLRSIPADVPYCSSSHGFDDDVSGRHAAAEHSVRCIIFEAASVAEGTAYVLPRQLGAAANDALSRQNATIPMHDATISNNAMPVDLLDKGMLHSMPRQDV